MRIIILLFILALHIISCGEAKDTPLIEAINLGNTEEVETLILDGADLNAKGGNGITALMAASFDGHIEIVKLLIDNGSDVQAKNDKDGATALMAASRNGHTEIVKLLIDNDTSVMSRFASRREQQGWRKAADVQAKNDKGVTSLMFASQNGHTEIVKLLIDNDTSVISSTQTRRKAADVNTTDNMFGRTALILASYKGHTEIVKILLDLTSVSPTYRADVNFQDKYGYTALMIASKEGHTEIVKLLIDNEADINAINNIGGSVLYYALLDEDNNEIAELLLEAGAEKHSPSIPKMILKLIHMVFLIIKFKLGFV